MGPVGQPRRLQQEAGWFIEEGEVLPLVLEFLSPAGPGVARTLASPGTLDFAPRIVLAYSLNAGKDTSPGIVPGGPGNTSIPAGFGVFYEAIKALTAWMIAGNACSQALGRGVTHGVHGRRK